MLVKDGRYLAKRTDLTTDPITLPVDSGISGIVVASSTAVATTALAVDSGASAGPTPSAPVFTVVVPSSSPSSTQSVDAVSKSIPVSTVIGSCIGAFIFVCVLIIIGVWFYRRYSESLRRQASARGRNLQNDKHRRRPWNKLEDDGDKWEGMNQTEEVDQVVPMEKLTMFKRAASVRTAYTQKSVDDHPLTYPQSFAPFDTNLVRTLSADIDSKSQPSQVANSVKGQTPSNISPSNNLGEPLSSSLNMAIPTPEATFLQSHKWESAEVLQYEGSSAEFVEPPTQDKDVRSMHNPFFGSQEYIRSKPDSHADDKSPGKERVHDSMTSSMLSSDPFAELVAQLPRPVLTHQASDSSASVESKTRALQTLMGALELSEDEIRERLRVASMHPSEFLTPIHEGFAKTSKP